MFQYRYRYLFILLLGGYSYFNILFTGGDQLVDFHLPQWMLASIVVGLVFLIWESNRLVQHIITAQRKRLGKVNPLVIHFLVSLVVSVAIALSPIAVLQLASPFSEELNWNTV